MHSDMPAMPGVAIVHNDERVRMDFTVALTTLRFHVVSAEGGSSPLFAAARIGDSRAAAMIVALDGLETATAIRHALMRSRARAVFLTPRMPPRAAVARAVSDYGGAMLGIDEPAVVIVATLVALLASARDGFVA